jgi:hypothetical protein
MEIPFIGGAYTGRSTNINAQTCVNLFPVIDNKEAKKVIALYGTPGLTEFTYVVSSGRYGLVVRALYTLGDYVYLVVNQNVYRVDSTGSGTSIGSLTTSNGFVSIADNGLEIIIVDGTSTGYTILLSTGVMAAITDPDFPASSSVTFQDGYFIVTEKDTGYIWISGLLDGRSWDSTDKTSVEGRPDNVRTVVSNTHDLWMFGEFSVEIFYNSGNADFPFERIPGALIDIGCAADASPIKINGRLYWLSNQGRVCRNQGYQYEFISTEHIDYQISKYENISDAIGFTYTLDNHSFYVLAFPSADKTWVYDTTTEYWHEWRSYKVAGESFGRHRANCATLLGRDWLVGDYTNGYVYKLSMDAYTDNSEVIQRQRATQTISKDRNFVLYHSLELEFEAGTGISGGVQGEDPQAVLDWSDDGGHNWSNQHWTSMGKIGEYSRRAIWRRMGRSRNRINRVTISDPVKIVIIGAYAELEACKA